MPKACILRTLKLICRTPYVMKCGLNVMRLGSRIRPLRFTLPFCLLKDDFRGSYLLLCLNLFISKWGKHKPTHRTVIRIKYVNTYKILYLVSITIQELNKCSYYLSQLSQIKMKSYTKILNVQYVRKSMKAGLCSIKKKKRQKNSG